MAYQNELISFRTPSEVYEWFLPHNWAEYEDDEETFAFFNTIKWSGNLRITPFTVKDWSEKDVERYIDDEVQNNSDAIIKTIGDSKCAYYEKRVIQDDEILLSHYWITGRGSVLFICSFTTSKEVQVDDWVKSEFEIVEKVICSIRITNQTSQV